MNTIAESPTAALNRVTLTPSLEHLAFEVGVPGDWQKLPLPEEAVDFEKPTTFLPLGVFMASYGAVIFAVAARPVYGEGTVSQWLSYLAREMAFSVEDSEPVSFGPLRGFQCSATQAAEMGRMRLRAVLVEDGGRMISLTLMAPEAIWPSVADTLDAMLQSFRLLDQRGPTVAVL